MKKVGDYNWVQLSMWDFAPKNSVNIYVKSSHSNDVFHFYLLRVVEITSERSYRTEVVTSLDGIPCEVLSYRNGELYLKVNGKNIKQINPCITARE